MSQHLPNNSGTFIAFEGIDGSGKTTQIKRLMQRLHAEKIVSYETREPTNSPMGSLIRQVMTGRIQTDNKVVAALFVADRLDHLLNETDGMMMHLNHGRTVITDRYYFSSYAYHSVDMDMDWVIAANAESAKILRPTVTIFIDVSPELAMDRIHQGRFTTELFETNERLQQVRQNYFTAFKKLEGEENIAIVNGDRDADAVAADIWKIVQPLL